IVNFETRGFGRLVVAETATCLSPSLFRREAARDKFAHAHLEMKREFPFDVGPRRRWTAAEARRRHRLPPDGSGGGADSAGAPAVAYRCQRAVAESSSARPRRVNV